MEDFYAAVELAKKIEKNALQHTEFSDKIEIKKTIDFEPREFEDLTYDDLLGMYERTEKIQSASKLFGQIPAYEGGAKGEKEQKIKTEEVESKVKEITTESLQKAEELSKELEQKPIEKMVIAKTPEGISDLELEFEKPKEEKGMPEITFEKEKEETQIEQVKREREKPGEKEGEEIGVKKEVKRPEEKIEIAKTIEESRPIEETPRVAPVAVPSILTTATASEAAESKFKDIEEYLTRELGNDNEKIRKKMLELTKNLFKEKSTNARERIKLEISALKSMLTRVREGTKKAAAPKQEHSKNMLEALSSTQLTELSTMKDEIQNSANKQIEDAKKRFFETIKGLGESESDQKKHAYEKLVFELTAVNEQLPQVLGKSEEFLVQKHQKELSNLSDSLGKGDAKIAKELEEQSDKLVKRYKKEFTALHDMVSKNINAIIESAGGQVFGREEKEAKINGIVYEINETDEGTLLYYLHSKDQEYYKKYERNHVSKGDAIHRAKILMAKEKGLSDNTISKYFGQIESD